MYWANIKTRSKILIGISIPLILLVILGGQALYSLGQYSTTGKWVNHTYNVLSKAEAIIASGVDMETGMRGYLLAGKEEFLDPYKSGEKSAYERIGDLQKTVSDNPGQVARLAEVENVLREWQSNVTEVQIQLRRDIGDAQTMNDMAELVGQAKGKAFFDKFRGQIATFIEREQVLLVKREQDFAELLIAPTVDSSIAKDTLKWVTHTYRVIAQANDIVAAAVDMETGMRGYLLAGKEEFLDPYKGGAERFYKLSDALIETVNDNPPQMDLLRQTANTIREWQKNVTEPMIALRRQIGDAKTMDDMADLVGEARGKAYFDKFRGLMSDFSAEESGLMETRKAENAATKSFTEYVISGGVIIALILGGGVGWLIGNGIAGPIGGMTNAMRLLAGGDKTVEIPGTDRGDEVGEMASAVLIFKENMIKSDEQAAEQAKEREGRERRAHKVDELTKGYDTEVSSVLETVAAAATELEATAGSMTQTATETSQQSTSASGASEKASFNVQTVASAAEELSSSISEISRQVSKSTEITGTAVHDANEANKMINGLVMSAQKIGEVVSLITDIADQTNLLALNATIEAARAGDAGKGFAVVASEVKNLANQTAKATEEISSQISGIQSATEDSVKSIEDITATINNINEISSAIAAAVEEQGAATQEIARSAEEALTATSEVTSNVGSVTTAASETGQSSGAVREAAQELSTQTENLSRMTQKFLGEVRSA